LWAVTSHACRSSMAVHPGLNFERRSIVRARANRA
jgi:hypothetical protein